MNKSFDDFKLEINEDELSNMFDIKFDNGPFFKDGDNIEFNTTELVAKLTDANLSLMKEALRQYHDFILSPKEHD